jgi:hypothetical protein
MWISGLKSECAGARQWDAISEFVQVTDPDTRTM